MKYQLPLHSTRRVIISASIPERDADQLQKIADKRARERGRFVSVSSIIREIVAEAIRSEALK